jgi:hypothetical protein
MPIRYADDFVILVSSTDRDPEQVRLIPICMIPLKFNS